MSINSTFTLYNTRIIKDKNMMIQSISSYLSSCSASSITFFQYVKIAPSLDIKATLSQDLVSRTSAAWNYCRIANDGNSNPFYYFIDAFEWIAPDTIRLKLTLDVLNTFSDDIIINNAFGSKTQVYREHRDRFKASSDGNYYIPAIDRISENMNFPMIRVRKQTITQTPNIDWYNVYIETAAEETLMMKITIPGQDVNVNVNQFTGTASIAGSDLNALCDENAIFFITKDENNAESNVSAHCILSHQQPYTAYLIPEDSIGSVDYDNNKPITLLAYEIVFGLSGSAYIMKSYSLWYYDDMTFCKRVLQVTTDTWTGGIGSITLANIFKIHKGTSPQDDSYGLRGILALPLQALTTSGTTTETAIAASANLEKYRYDDLTGKIIAFPYAPFDLQYDDGALTLPSNYALINHALIEADSIEGEHNDISFNMDTRMSAIFPRMAKPYAKTLRDHSEANETKLLNSEFTMFKFAYDNFYYEWKMENQQFVPVYGGDITLRMKASSSMLSEFSFAIQDFSGYAEESGSIKRDADYDDVFIVSRNNEISVYSSSYLSYMRSGYNYDQKKKALDTTQNAFNVTISALGVVASAAASVFTSGAAAPALIASGTSLVSSIANLGINETARDNTYAQKIKDLISQGSNVTGCTDFDIMKGYTNNRVSLIMYRTESQYRTAAYNFLRLYGYASKGQYAPDLTTREFYNFIQCVPDWCTEAGSAIPVQYRDLLTAKFQDGVTIFHLSSLLNGYDFDQKYENWEGSIT